MVVKKKREREQVLVFFRSEQVSGVMIKVRWDFNRDSPFFSAIYGI